MRGTNGLGQGIDSVVGGIADKIVASLMPRMKEVVAQASEAAEPTIRKVIQEDVLPKFGIAVVLGLAAGAAMAAAIGSYFATRRNPGRTIRRRAA